MESWQRGWRGYPYLGSKLETNAQYGKRKVTVMSGVLWCEAQGWKSGHAFSSKDPEVQTFTRALKVPANRGNSYGRPVIQEETVIQEEFHICGPHAREQGLFQPDIVDEIEPGEREYDPAYTRALEKKLGMPPTDLGH